MSAEHLDSALLQTCYLSRCFSHMSQDFFVLKPAQGDHMSPPKRSLSNRKNKRESQMCDAQNYDTLEIATDLTCAASLTHFVGILGINASSAISA